MKILHNIKMVPWISLWCVTQIVCDIFLGDQGSYFDEILEKRKELTDYLALY